MNSTKNSDSGWRFPLLAVLFMFPLTILMSVAMTQAVNPAEWAYGWAVSMVNVLLALLIYGFASRKAGKAFWIWAIGVNSLRALGMVAVAVVVAIHVVGRPLPYLIALLSGVFCMMAAEVSILNRRLF